MLDFRSYRVSIRVNGKDLPIYQPEYDEGTKTATCWIASEQGQAYSVICQQDKSISYPTSAKVYLDGSKTDSTRILFGKGYGRSARMRGVRVSATARCPFQFASLETTDDDAYLDRPPDLKAPGTIRVQMYRVQVTGRSSWKPNCLPKTSSMVHERSKKAGGHVTQFGKQEVSRCTPQSFSTKPYTSSDIDPWVAFEFRYRPAAILQAEGIMPKPRASRSENQDNGGAGEETKARHKAEISALEVIGDGENSSFDRDPLTILACIKVEQAELNERRAALKARFGNLKVKREGSPIRVPRSAVAEVIDLTLEYVRISLGLDSTPERLKRGVSLGISMWSAPTVSTATWRSLRLP
ncbi:hypothetical protein M407DRAFT_9251 [Tulasnella calospora MUT 4182]|uniref:DUF7918 domain-containing protein n=1 Tax=Tulasnella calospora MUT 4182 TaxID=1051891 RepID=A0A0C3LR32_9AGAM|nr:hypothetical protein M407DRAFT_9251 [Tulasnella calospora MUT 4182]